jgi:hypothetical protein
VKQRASLVDFYYYAQSLLRSGYAYKIALAFPKEMHHDNLDFFVLAAGNQGHRIKLFENVEDAVSWATDGEEKD